MAFKSRDVLEPGKSWHEAVIASALAIFPEYVQSSKKVVVSDCDGILTDSKSLYTKDGKIAKTYGAYDKEMIELMVELGWRFIFVTTDKAGAMITDARLTHLEKINHRMMSHQELGARERAKLVRELVASGSKVLFVGDSLSDIEALSAATWAATTANAPYIVKRYCNYASQLDGASGGFADILHAMHEEIMRCPAKSGFLAGDAIPSTDNTQH